MSNEDPPETLEAATRLSRRDLLGRARLQIAMAIDQGVPPHALARLIGELDRIDAEIRRIDDDEAEEPTTHIPDEPFDLSEI